MRFRSIAANLAAGLLFLFCSCATRPIFDYQSGSGLALGSTTTAEARTLLGKPDYERNLKNSLGQFAFLTYWYAKGTTTGDIVHDTLTLTFKDDVLEQYCFQSPSGKEVWRRIEIDQVLKRLKTGTSTRTDAVTALGPPSGTTLCRTLKHDPKDRNELCYWIQTLPGRRHYRTVTITFDDADIISEIQQTESQPD